MHVSQPEATGGEREVNGPPKSTDDTITNVALYCSSLLSSHYMSVEWLHHISCGLTFLLILM